MFRMLDPLKAVKVDPNIRPTDRKLGSHAIEEHTHTHTSSGYGVKVITLPLYSCLFPLQLFLISFAFLYRPHTEMPTQRQTDTLLRSNFFLLWSTFIWRFHVCFNALLLTLDISDLCLLSVVRDDHLSFCFPSRHQGLRSKVWVDLTRPDVGSPDVKGYH